MIAFQQRYPDITVFCHSGERVVDLFADGVDVALRLSDLNTDDVIAKPLMTLETLFVASRELIAHHGTPEALEEMARLPVAAWESLNQGLFEWNSGTEKVKYKPVFSSNQPSKKITLHQVYARHKYPSALVRAYLEFCSEWVEKLH